MFEETMRLEPESSFGYALAAWAHWWSVDQGLSAADDCQARAASDVATFAIERGMLAMVVLQAP